MPKSLTMFALLTGLTGLFIAPSPAFAQVCNPALAAGFLYQCPAAADGLFFDHRGFRHFRGDDGFHDNHGFHGDGGENNFWARRWPRRRHGTRWRRRAWPLELK